MISPICNKCKKELDNFGGIILSPPVPLIYPEINSNEASKVWKYHLCQKCWKLFEKWVNRN